MIPIRLELKNFLPYRSPVPLLFEGIHLACLTGSNGAGKSSLLDAITWALWGTARAKVQDDLIHLGRDHMSVQLDFEQEGMTWRVLRRRNSGKRGQSTLDLLLLSTEDGQPRIESGNTIHETQDKINRLLRLDYRTFTHSAFLQQGKADAFTTLTPADRKRVLSDILGLEQWERYEKRVKDRLTEITAQIHNCEGAIAEIERELATRPQVESQLADARTAFAEAEEARKAAEALRDEVQAAPSELRHAEANYHQSESRLKRHETDLNSLDNEIATHQQNLANYDKVIARREDIEAGYATLQKARASDESFNQKFRDLRSIDKRRNDLQKQVDAERARLDSEIAALERQITDLEAQTERDFSQDLASVQAEVSALEARDAERQRLDEAMRHQREQKAALEGLRETLAAQGQAVRDRLERLDAAEGDPVCPLCGQPLDDDHRLQLVNELNAEIEARRDEYRQNEESIVQLAGAIDEQRGTLDDMERELKRLAPLSERAGSLQAQADAVQEAARRLETARGELAELRVVRDNEDFAQEARAGLDDIAQEEAALNYDAGQHEHTQEQIRSFSAYEEDKRQLAIAETAIISAKDALEEKSLRRKRLLEAITQAQTELERFRQDIAHWTGQVALYHERQKEAARQLTLEQAAYGRLSNAKQQLEALDAQAERKIKKEAERENLRVQEALYNDLKQAFGKHGIPTMMIESAAPELEAEANALLSRMTDGRMHLRISTQRAKASGGTAETLDLEIADELGTRSYELYSGGEAFRINFAVRVALSKMLARRAGAHLRTLFIDEGFGTQDEAGRNKLVEAITAIQDEFDLILVITHIDELRDSFPVHIVVEKAADGSTISIR